MQASTSQVESYADFNISHPVPDFKAVRSLKIPNYEFLNKPRPFQRCERVWEGLCNYECPMNGHLLWSWELHILDLARYWLLKSVEATFWKSFYRSKTILEVISCLKIFQKRFESFCELSARMHDAASWWTWWSLWRFCGAVVCCQTR